MMEQRPLTDNEIKEAEEVLKRKPWVEAIFYGVVCSIGIWKALEGSQFGVALLIFGVVILTIQWRVRNQAYKKFKEDVNVGIAEIIEGPPQKVRADRFNALVWMSGRKIRVPNIGTSVGSEELKKATFVRIAVLPKSNIAVHVHATKGIGLS
jgi:hypothetical protein